MIAPVAPITVGVFSGKWDRQFPLHRLSRLWDGYYYVSTHLRGSFGGITDQQLLALAGLPKRTPCADGHSCFGAFESARGGLSERIAFDRRPAAAEDGGGLTPWRLVRGERGALAHGKETPAALTGLSGELLRLLHYDPEECSRELLLFFWKRPSGTAQSGALWVSLLGGLKPLAIMARVHRLPLGVGVRVALHYTREMDAAEAAKQAHIHLASLVEGEPLTLDVHKKRVIITFVVTKPILRRLFQSATLKGGK